MAKYRKVFFSFHYAEDVTRAMVVRKSWVTKGGQEAARFVDKAEFEKVKKQGDLAIKRWINKQMTGTTVTVVLIGAKTCNRKWVKYEISHSIERGNGLLEIDISKIPNFQEQTTTRCGWMLPAEYPDYDWKEDNGFENLGKWIEKAAKKADH